MEVFLATAKIMLSIGFLFYASWSDYKTREVSNRVWIYYAPIALILSLIELSIYQPTQLPFFALSFGLTTGFALLLFYTGGFGGADSKALMCIALALPFAPILLLRPILAEAISPISQIIFPLTILSNAVLFAAATGIYMILYNIFWHKKHKTTMFTGTLASESIGKKLVVLITGYKVTIARLKEKWHIYPMEDIDEENSSEDLKRKLVIVPKDEGRNEIVERLNNAAESGKIDNRVWATPGLPMLIFVTIGLIVALLFGDLVWLIIRFVLG